MAMCNGAADVDSVNRMTMWEYTAILQRWNDAHQVVENLPAPSEEDYFAGREKMMSRNASRNIRLH
jgi:hypothetical protein